MSQPDLPRVVAFPRSGSYGEYALASAALTCAVRPLVEEALRLIVGAHLRVVVGATFCLADAAAAHEAVAGRRVTGKVVLTVAERAS